jgi:hypothetical protein
MHLHASQGCHLTGRHSRASASTPTIEIVSKQAISGRSLSIGSSTDRLRAWLITAGERRCVFHTVIETIKDDIGRDNPVVQSVEGIISSELVASGERVRAADALLVAKTLDAEIGRRPMPSPVVSKSPLSTQFRTRY